jgi:hypothetical protein
MTQTVIVYNPFKSSREERRRRGGEKGKKSRRKKEESLEEKKQDRKGRGKSRRWADSDTSEEDEKMDWDENMVGLSELYGDYEEGEYSGQDEEELLRVEEGDGQAEAGGEGSEEPREGRVPRESLGQGGSVEQGEVAGGREQEREEIVMEKEKATLDIPLIKAREYINKVKEKGEQIKNELMKTLNVNRGEYESVLAGHLEDLRPLKTDGSKGEAPDLGCS